MVLNSKNAAERAAKGLPEPPLCKAHARDGSPCKKSPSRGATVCRMHGAGAPQVKEAARNRLAMAADGLMTTLLKIASSAESEAVRLAATRDALDRAGFGAAQMVKLAVAQPWEEFLSDLVLDGDLFEDVPAESRPRRAIPSGLGVSDDDEDEDYDRTAVQYIDDDDAPSFKTHGTIRGEVVRDYSTPSTPEQRAAAARTERRAQAGLTGRAEHDQRSEYSERDSEPSTDPTRPPRYVREAMEADGDDWRGSEGGGSRPADFGA